MGKTKVIGGWYTFYQDQIEYYDSQQAALLAVDSILANYKSGIWSNNSYFSLGHQDRETVDMNLFESRYSTNVLTRSTVSGMFRIDIYAKNKEDWIFKYGSDLLQQSLRAGYDCNEGYLAERLVHDYPGFIAKEWGKYKKVDTPNEICLYACLGYEHSYCSIDKEDYYITIDNYLGKYQLVKFIDPNLEIIRLTPQSEVIATIEQSISAITPVINEKEQWIIEHGSDLLQQSLMAGYDCGNRYLQERIACDYPGFEINLRNYSKVNSPDERCLYACLGYEGAYCSSNNASYYITIDNFLGKYQLVKPIDNPLKVVESSSVQTAANMFVTQMRRYGNSINSSPIALALVATSAYVFLTGFVCFAAYILLS